MSAFQSTFDSLRGFPRRLSDAAREVRRTASLAGAAMLAALSLVLNQFTIAVSQFLEIGFSFLAAGTCAFLYGPWLAGLMGIVTDVGANYATVRSIIDDSSRVSAMPVDSEYSCIVAGDLTQYEQGRLRITDFSKDEVVKDGDQIVTSNISTKFLPGILIGYAVDVTVDSEHLTQSGYLIPVVDFDNLQEVFVITDVKEMEEATPQ